MSLNPRLFPTCRHVVSSPGHGEDLGVAVLDAGHELDGGAVWRFHAQHHATRVQPEVNDKLSIEQRKKQQNKFRIFTLIVE